LPDAYSIAHGDDASIAFPDDVPVYAAFPDDNPLCIAFPDDDAPSVAFPGDNSPSVAYYDDAYCPVAIRPRLTSTTMNLPRLGTPRCATARTLSAAPGAAGAFRRPRLP
jgi:hypothetical protein